MDSNKDESEKCLRIAEKYIRAGDRDKAIKFLNKAQKLYPSERARGVWIFALEVIETNVFWSSWSCFWQWLGAGTRR